MRISRDGEIYRASRITGPHHNLLGLGLSAEASSKPQVERLGPRADDAGVDALDQEQVVAHALHGVAEANRRLGTRFGVARIQYLPTDTPPASAYAVLAARIVEEAARDHL
jgi:hypothetical protein